MADRYLMLRPSKCYVSHIWRTVIHTKLSGVERRAALYSTPRIKMEIDILTGQHTAQRSIRAGLFHNAPDIWGVPMWSNLTEITSTASGTTIPCDTRYGHFYVGQECVVINKNVTSWSDYEVRTITNVSDTELTVSGTLTSSWAKDNYVVPMYNCRIKDANAGISRQVRSADTISLTAVEALETGYTSNYETPASGTLTYRDKEVLLNKPISPKDESWLYTIYGQQDMGFGFTYTYQTDAVRKYNNRFILGTREEISDLLNFFDRHMGRYACFWFPTWNQDINIVSAVAADDVILNIEDIDYDTEWFVNDLIGRRLYIQLPDGSYVFRRVTNATSNTIVLDSAIGTAVSASNLSKLLISFLELGRFDQDEIEIEPIQARENLAYVSLSFHGLIQEEDDYAPAPVSITAYPAASADDGYWYGVSWNNNWADLILGDSSGNEGHVFVRFPDVDVPQGATITEAFVRFKSYNSRSDVVHVKIYFNASDDATAPGNKTEQQNKVKTSYIDWDIYDSWVSGTQYDTVDISSIIQEVVDRPGWSEGNAMMVLIENDGSGYNNKRGASSYNHSSGVNKPELHITYTSE